MWVVELEPGEPQDKRRVAGVQDEKLDGLMMIAGEKQANRGGLVSDSAQNVAIQGSGRDRVRQENPLET